jgi:hypothetical protein
MRLIFEYRFEDGEVCLLLIANCLLFLLHATNNLFFGFFDKHGLF